MNSLYDTMMLEKTCSETELKQRYYKLTRHYNPNSKNGNYDKYLEVVKAYNILKDSYKRHFYDTFGESGLQNIEEARKGYFLTRTFDHVNLRLVTVAIILLILNISFLPLSLYLHQKIALSFTTIFAPAMMAFVLIGLFVLRSFVYCKRYTMERMGNEMTYMAVIGVISLLFLLQTIIMCCVVDLNVTSCKYLWLVPYIIFECILFAKYLINKPEERSRVVKNLWPRMSRLICMHMFLLDTRIKYKIFITLKLAVIEMYARKMTNKAIMATGVCILLGLLGVFVCIEPPCRWVAYILGALYIAAGIICVVGVKKAKQKYAPRCKFGKQPMIDYEI